MLKLVSFSTKMLGRDLIADTKINIEKHMKMHSVGKTKTFSNEEKVEAVALAK